MTCPSELERSRALTLGASGADGADSAGAAIEAHLATCAPCRAAWDADRAAIDLARELPVTMPPPARREEVRTAILAASTLSLRPLAHRRWLAPTVLGAAAAGLVAYVAVPYVASSSPPPSPSTRAAVHPHPGARYVAL